MQFNTELDMVKTIKESDYIKGLTSHYHSLYMEEVDGFFGVPDIVVIINHEGKQLSYAYEAKLKNWKRALFQAFRYKAFVNKSYVILDHAHIKPAVSQLERFQRSNVGLMSINNLGEVFSYYTPSEEVPYSPQTAKRFNKMIETELKNIAVI